jgi:hypothetical protein
MVVLLSTVVSSEQTVRMIDIPLGYFDVSPLGTIMYANATINPPDGVTEILSLEFLLIGDYPAATTMYGGILAGPTFVSCTPNTWLSPNILSPNYATNFDCTDLVVASGWQGSEDPLTLAWLNTLDVTNLKPRVRFTYMNDPVGSIDVLGTYYEVGDDAKIIAQLSEEGVPINNASCYTSIYKPDNSVLIQNAHMTRISDEGMYVYDLIAPSTVGVYPVSVACDYVVSITNQAPSDVTFKWGASNSTLNNTFEDDGVNYVIETEPVSEFKDNEVLYLAFDNDSEIGDNDTYFVDLSGEGHNGFCTGSSCPTYVTDGKRNGALRFDETDDFINFSNYDLDITDEITVAMWVKPNETTSTEWIIPFSKGDVWGDITIGMNVDDGWALFAVKDNTDTVKFNGYYGDPLYNQSEWVFVAGTYDSTGMHKIYILNTTSDELYVKQIAQPNPIKNDNEDVPFLIDYSSEVGGLIDEVIVLNVALNDSEMNDLFRNTYREAEGIDVDFEFVHNDSHTEMFLDWQGTTDLEEEIEVNWWNYVTQSWDASINTISSAYAQESFEPPNDNLSLYISTGNKTLINLQVNNGLRYVEDILLSDNFEDTTLDPFYEFETTAPIDVSVTASGPLNQSYSALITSGDFFPGDFEEGGFAIDINASEYFNISITYTREVVGSESSDTWWVQTSPDNSTWNNTLESWTGNSASARNTYVLSEEYDYNSNIAIRWRGNMNFVNDFMRVDDIIVKGTRRGRWTLETDVLSMSHIEATGVVNEVRGGAELNIKDRLSDIEDDLEDILDDTNELTETKYEVDFVMPQIYSPEDVTIVTVYLHQWNDKSIGRDDANCTLDISGPANENGTGPLQMSEVDMNNTGDGLYIFVAPSPPGGWPHGIYQLEVNCDNGINQWYNTEGFRMWTDFESTIDDIYALLQNVSDNSDEILDYLTTNLSSEIINMQIDLADILSNQTVLYGSLIDIQSNITNTYNKVATIESFLISMNTSLYSEINENEAKIDLLSSTLDLILGNITQVIDIKIDNVLGNLSSMQSDLSTIEMYVDTIENGQTDILANLSVVYDLLVEVNTTIQDIDVNLSGVSVDVNLTEVLDGIQDIEDILQCSHSTIILCDTLGRIENNLTIINGTLGDIQDYLETDITDALADNEAYLQYINQTVEDVEDYLQNTIFPEVDDVEENLALILGNQSLILNNHTAIYNKIVDVENDVATNYAELLTMQNYIISVNDTIIQTNASLYAAIDENGQNLIAMNTTLNTLLSIAEDTNLTVHSIDSYLQNTLYPAVDDVEGQLVNVLLNTTNIYSKLLNVDTNVSYNRQKLDTIESLIGNVNTTIVNEINANEAKLDVIDGVVDAMQSYLTTNITNMLLEINGTIDVIDNYLVNTIYPAIDDVEGHLVDVLSNQTNIFSELLVLKNNLTTNYNQLVAIDDFLSNMNTSLTAEIIENRDTLLIVNNTIDIVVDDVSTVQTMIESIFDGQFELTIFGTDYAPGDNGRVFIQLVRNNTGYSDAICTVDIHNPSSISNGTDYYVESALMFSLGVDGFYYYDFVVPDTVGIYMVGIDCFTSVGTEVIAPYADNLIEGSVSSGSVSNLGNEDLSYYSLNEQTNTFLNRSYVHDFYFDMSSIPSNATFTALVMIGYMNPSSAETIDFSVYNFSGSNWVLLPNTLPSQAGSTNVMVTNTGDGSGLSDLINGSNITIVRLTDTLQTLDFQTSTINIDSLEIGGTFVQAAPVIGLRGGGEINVRNKVNITNISNQINTNLQIVNQTNLTTSNIYSYLQNTIYPEIDNVEEQLSDVLNNQTNIWSKLLELQGNITTNYDELLIIQAMVQNVNTTLTTEINENEAKLDVIDAVVDTILDLVNNTIVTAIDDMQIDIDAILNITNNILSNQSGLHQDIVSVNDTINALNITSDFNALQTDISGIRNRLDCNHTFNEICDRLDDINFTLTVLNTTSNTYFADIFDIVVEINNSVEGIDNYLVNTLYPAVDDVETNLLALLSNQTNIWNKMIEIQDNITSNANQLDFLETLISNINTSIITEINDNEVKLDLLDTTIDMILNKVNITQILINDTVLIYLDNINATVTGIEADTTYISGRVDLIYNDTQDILDKWGSYTAQDLIDNVTNVGALVENVQTWLIAFNTTEESRYQNVMNAASTTQSYVLSINTSINNLITDLGYSGMTTTLYQDVQNLLSNISYLNTSIGTLGDAINLSFNETLTYLININDTVHNISYVLNIALADVSYFPNSTNSSDYYTSLSISESILETMLIELGITTLQDPIEGDAYRLNYYFYNVDTGTLTKEEQTQVLGTGIWEMVMESDGLEPINKANQEYDVFLRVEMLNGIGFWQSFPLEYVGRLNVINLNDNGARGPGLYDVIVTNVYDTWDVGESVAADVLIKNTGDMPDQDTVLTYWLEDSGGNRFSETKEQFLEIPVGVMNLRRELPLPSMSAEGEWRFRAEYETVVQPKINVYDAFLVEDLTFIDKLRDRASIHLRQNLALYGLGLLGTLFMILFLLIFALNTGGRKRGKYKKEVYIDSHKRTVYTDKKPNVRR